MTNDELKKFTDDFRSAVFDLRMAYFGITRFSVSVDSNNELVFEKFGIKHDGTTA